MATAQQMFDALAAAGYPARGIVMPNPADSSTWILDGVPDAERALAISVIQNLDATLAQQDASAQTARKIAVALIAYIWKLNHSGTNPTPTQLQGEVDKLKAIYLALP